MFEEWADQLAFEQSIFFHEYDRLAEAVCTEIVRKLGELELSVLAAFSNDFDEYSCTDEFMEKESFEGFSVLDAISKELYQRTSDFALNWAEERRLGESRALSERSESRGIPESAKV